GKTLRCGSRCRNLGVVRHRLPASVLVPGLTCPAHQMAVICCERIAQRRIFSTTRETTPSPIVAHSKQCGERIMRNLIGAGFIALVVTGLVPAVGAVLMVSLAPTSQPVVTVKTRDSHAHARLSAMALSNARAVSWISSGHVAGP